MSKHLRCTALVILAVGVLVPAGLAAQDVVYTGCIKSGDGSLYNVRQATTPMAPCKGKDKQISWNMAGQPGPTGPQGLPGESCSPIHITVHCGEPGETVAAALQQAGWGPNQLVITVSGVCTEAVQIGRNNTTLRGGADGAGLVNPESTGDVLSVGAKDVKVDRLTLQGGSVLVGRGSSVRITNSSVRDSPDNGVTIVSSFVEFTNTTVEYSAREGVKLDSGSTVRFENCWIHHNDGALDVANGSFADLGGGSRFTDNTGGIAVSFGSMLHVSDVVIENNLHDGIGATGGSVVHFGYGGGVAVIRGNTGNGVFLRDTSLVTSLFEGGAAEITGNGGWGVFCSAPPAVAQIVGPLGTVSGNLAGEINCPTSW
jgi:hypothetical protein